jgi:diguanylate cyclase (GGDEF)-like protein
MIDALRRVVLALPVPVTALIVTAVSVALSLAATSILMISKGVVGPPRTFAYAIAMAVPIVVATPVGWLIARLLHEVQEARDAALRLAWCDELTGLMTRRRFVELGRRELDLARRSGHALSAGLLDLDNFKRINDLHGHAVGDEVLSAAGKVFEQAMRSTDLCCRWGGEEFAFIMPGVGGEDGVRAMQRLLAALRACELRVPGSAANTPLRFTASIGVAALDTHLDNFERLLDSADLAMYGAKRSGKNTVVLFDRGALSEASLERDRASLPGP